MQVAADGLVALAGLETGDRQVERRSNGLRGRASAGAEARLRGKAAGARRR